MKKTNILLLLATLILGGTAYYFIQKNNKTSNLEGYDFNFAVKDTANIGKIFLADRQGKQITLKRLSQSVWSVNDSYRARPDAVKNLLSTINRVELMYRLARAGVKNVVEDIATNGIKVEIYDTRNQKMKVYYVGGENNNADGTHFMMEDANEPYVVHIPNFQGTLRVRYFTELLDWRDRNIFTEDVEDIEALSVEYAAPNTGSSFKLARTGTNSYNVEPFFPIATRYTQAANNKIVESYLTGFRMTGAEGFENAKSVNIDSLNQLKPFATINLKNKKDNKIVKFYQIIPRNSDGEIILGKNEEIQIERYYAIASTGDIYTVQHIVFGKLFWAYPAFFR